MLEFPSYYDIVIDNVAAVIHIIKRKTCFHTSIKYLAAVVVFG